MPQMSPTLWFPILIILTSMILMLKTKLHFKMKNVN
nr:ATP synthase F0 subunit 8 [Kinnaridae sp.]